MSDFLPFALPDIGEEEIAEVVSALRSGWVTKGLTTKQLEACGMKEGYLETFLPIIIPVKWPKVEIKNARFVQIERKLKLTWNHEHI